jgi:hypothetical protein
VLYFHEDEYVIPVLTNTGQSDRSGFEGPERRH